MSLEFQIEATSGSARRGRLLTSHGEVETPVFMPVGTLASVKGVSQDILEELDVQILLGNTYHLYLRPGVEQVRKLGGLHRFMSWPRAILTDSGGFQVFSLSELRKVTEDGVTFRSHLDGSRHVFTPESAMDAQIGLGADIIMAFDECTEHPADPTRVRQSMELTLRWAERSKKHFEAHKHEVPWNSARNSTQALFGIVQGGMDPRPAKGVRRTHYRNRIPRVRDWRSERRRASPSDSRDRRSHARPSTERQTAVSHGRRHAGRNRGIFRTWHRHDGLRASHARGPARAAVYVRGEDLHQASAICRG